jgi:hypothetical protein
VDLGSKQKIFEIKSSKTVQEKYFDALKYWHSLSKTELENLYLIYGGKENHRRNGMNVLSWNNIFRGAVEGAV